MKTRQDLIIAVLEYLNAVGVGQTPAAEDIATVDKRVDTQISLLGRRGIIYLADTQEFDDEVVDPLAVVIWSACAPAYGQAPSKAAVVEAENLLREIQTGDGAGSGSVKALYY